jgi:hypothetical protein
MILLVGYPAGARVKLDSNSRMWHQYAAGINAQVTCLDTSAKGRVTPIAPPDRTGSNDLAGGIIADCSESWLGQNREFPNCDWITGNSEVNATNELLLDSRLSTRNPEGRINRTLHLSALVYSRQFRLSPVWLCAKVSRQCLAGQKGALAMAWLGSLLLSQPLFDRFFQATLCDHRNQTACLERNQG